MMVMVEGQAKGQILLAIFCKYRYNRNKGNRIID